MRVIIFFDNFKLHTTSITLTFLITEPQSIFAYHSYNMDAAISGLVRKGWFALIINVINSIVHLHDPTAMSHH